MIRNKTHYRMLILAMLVSLSLFSTLEAGTCSQCQARNSYHTSPYPPFETVCFGCCMQLHKQKRQESYNRTMRYVEQAQQALNRRRRNTPQSSPGTSERPAAGQWWCGRDGCFTKVPLGGTGLCGQCLRKKQLDQQKRGAAISAGQGSGMVTCRGAGCFTKVPASGHGVCGPCARKALARRKAERPVPTVSWPTYVTPTPPPVAKPPPAPTPKGDPKPEIDRSELDALLKEVRNLSGLIRGEKKALDQLGERMSRPREGRQTERSGVRDESGSGSGGIRKSMIGE